jgi:hypothetical protein
MGPCTLENEVVATCGTLFALRTPLELVGVKVAGLSENAVLSTLLKKASVDDGLVGIVVQSTVVVVRIVVVVVATLRNIKLVSPAAA